MVQMLVQDSTPKGLELISQKMPRRIEDALDFPVVREVIAVTGDLAVRRYIEFELIKLAGLVNVGQNLTDFQIPFVAEELLRTYPNETLADFRLCFQRAAMGQYGDVFRLDPIVIGKWMKLYLEEKYQVMEDELMKSKEGYKDQYVWKDEGGVSDEKARQYLRDWHDRVMAAKIETKANQDRKRATGYKDPHPPEYYEMRDKIRRTASEFYKDKYSFSGMQVWKVGEYEVFAESFEDAKEIIKQAGI